MKFYHWLFLFLSHILLFACEKSQPHFKWDDKAFSYQQDILFYQGKPFSGVLDTFFQTIKNLRKEFIKWKA
jgi:hypothetical protein